MNRLLLAGVLVVYVLALFGVALWARRRIHDTRDYLVAGRRLGVPLASATLFATWFGAGTMLAASNEVRTEGVAAAALDPLGAGCCLLLAGVFFARRLWQLELLTVIDFFRLRFGPRAELVGGLLMVPGYLGWIAAQFVALASMLELFFGIDPRLGIALVATVGTGYTLLGGMWSVTATDAIQATLVVAGLGALLVTALASLGGAGAAGGLARIANDSPSAMLEIVPTGDLAALVAWLSLFAAGALGNLPGQDLMQRVFSARSARTAQLACFVGGGAYLLFGSIPVVLGLAGNLLAPGRDGPILPILAELLLSPALAVLFVLTLSSAVLSTIDSAILAPSSVLAQNVLARFSRSGGATLARNQWAVLGVAATSVAVAYLGEDAYSLLESTYEFGLVSLLVPLATGLYWRRGGERAALAAMGVGTSLWTTHRVFGWEWFAAPWTAPLSLPLPMGLCCALAALGAFVATASRADGHGAR